MERGVEWEERAEEICRVLWTRALSKKESDADLDVEFVTKALQAAFKEGQRDGTERAAKMAENIVTVIEFPQQSQASYDTHGKEIAAAIRQALKRVEEGKE